MSLTRAYHLLTGLSDRLHSGHGLSAGVRSILLLLDWRGPLTLSEIARDRAVSRQLIQRLSGPLIFNELIEPRPNAANRRSPKLVLTTKGQSVVKELLMRERMVADLIAETFNEEELDQAHSTMAKLNLALTRVS